MTVDPSPDASDITKAQIDQLVWQIDQLLLEIEQAQERLLSLAAKLSLMKDQAGLIRRDVRVARVYQRLHSKFEQLEEAANIPAAGEEVLRTALSR
jgi:chorismate mutase